MLTRWIITRFLLTAADLAISPMVDAGRYSLGMVAEASESTLVSEKSALAAGCVASRTNIAWLREGDDMSSAFGTVQRPTRPSLSIDLLL